MGSRSRPGPPRLLAERIGGFVQEADAERRHQTRIASMELDKLALYRGTAPIGPDDVTALVAEAVPGSVWAFTDAVGERRVEQALELLDRLLETTPEPVLLAVLHRRVRELIETGDRLAAGERLPRDRQGDGRQQRIPDGASCAIRRRRGRRTSCRPRSTASSSSMRWSRAMPGEERADAQRRLAFSLWVIDHAGRTAASGPPDRQWPGGPGLLLDDEVALDGEDAAALAEVEQLDQLGIDVQLRAVLAQAAGDAEAQPLAAIGQAERRVEPGRDEPAGTGGAAVSNGGHAATL